jgi:hypothetical protein
MPLFTEVQTALERCMEAEPPTAEPYFALSLDSSNLADVFAEMLYGKEQARPLEALTEKQRTAFERWKETV